jgi:hydroxylamine reductase
MNSYSSNIFTSGPVGWPSVKHIENRDFTPAINKALELPGFPVDTEGKTVMVGFGEMHAKRSVTNDSSVKREHIKSSS